MSNRKVILVLSHPRSGTSALTRVLSLCGCALPESVFGATELSPSGFWEPVEAVKLNIDFLALQADMRTREIAMEATEKEVFISKIQGFLSKCGSGPELVLKVPGLLDLWDFWSEALSRSGFTIQIVIALRKPHEVCISTEKMMTYLSGRYGIGSTGQTFDVEAFNRFWLNRFLLAERYSRSSPRVFVEYSNFLENWRHEVIRVSKALSIEMDIDKRAINHFLTRNFHRNRSHAAMPESWGSSWVTRVYEILGAAAQDRPIDFGLLDEIYNEYSTHTRPPKAASRSDLQRTREYLDSLPVWRSGVDY